MHWRPGRPCHAVRERAQDEADILAAAFRAAEEALQIFGQKAMTPSQAHREGFQIDGPSVPAIPRVTMDAEIVSVFDEGTDCIDADHCVVPG